MSYNRFPHLQKIETDFFLFTSLFTCIKCLQFYQTYLFISDILYRPFNIFNLFQGNKKFNACKKHLNYQFQIIAYIFLYPFSKNYTHPTVVYAAGNDFHFQNHSSPPSLHRFTNMICLKIKISGILWKGKTNAFGTLIGRNQKPPRNIHFGARWNALLLHEFLLNEQAYIENYPLIFL